MPLRRMLKQWREKDDGTLEGPALSINGHQVYIQSEEPESPDDDSVWINK